MKFGWKKTKTKLMAWRKTTIVKRRSCGEGGAEAEVEARQTRLGQALCWLHLLTTFTGQPTSPSSYLCSLVLFIFLYICNWFCFFFQIWEAAVMKQEREAVVWQRVSPVKGGALVMQKPLVVQKQLVVRRWCDRAALWDPVRPRRRLEAWRLGLVFFLVLLLLLFLILV